MKKLLYIIGCLSLLMASCDKVDEYIVYAGATAEWTPGSGVANKVQRALLEKYTGPHCTNCPPADEVIHGLMDTYGDKLVAVSIVDSSNFGLPYANQPDLRTQEGNLWSQYFGISRDSIATAKKEDDAMMKGIDVSVHNGTIDWQKVKDTGIDFAILRAGYGRFESQKDTKFEDNYAGAKAVGLPIGAYWYSYATTPDEAKQEAEVCISILNGKQFEYPIFFDLEEKSALDTGKENCSAMVKAFCDALENAGYYAGFYMSRSPLTTHITEEVQKRYALWVAEWNSTLNYSGSVGLWQFSSRGFVDGITGNVDLDVGYVEYPDIIKTNGLNGFPKPVAEEKAPVLEQAPPASAADQTVSATIQIGNDTYKGTLVKE